MGLGHTLSSWCRQAVEQVRRLPDVPRDLVLTAAIFLLAYWACSILIHHTGGQNNSSLVFVLAVVLISLVTKGYIYGIAASIVGAFFINYSFMYPYAAFSLSISGYPPCCPWWPSPVSCAP